MEILIVANGNINRTKFYAKIIKKANIIIAADGGADSCIRLGINPDHVIGDFDSISPRAKNKFKNILIHDKNQNTTDLEKAISLANKLNCTRLTIIGAIGSRIDHTLSNIISLSRSKAHSEIIDEANTVFLAEKELKLKGKKNDIVSVIPISKVAGLSYTGLKWKPKSGNVDSGWIGVSNRMTGTDAVIRLKSGKIIVIKPNIG
jgi:thiamine pyrophosphokinase